MSSVNILNMIPKITALPLHRTNTYDNSMAGVTQPASRPASQPRTLHTKLQKIQLSPNLPYLYTLQLFDSTLFQLCYIWAMIYTIFFRNTYAVLCVVCGLYIQEYLR